jgi:hypothetical protein
LILLRPLILLHNFDCAGRSNEQTTVSDGGCRVTNRDLSSYPRPGPGVSGPVVTGLFSPHYATAVQKGINLSDGEISLYFGLREGQRADLEVVALAAIEWAAAVRAAALEIDPEAQIRIQFVDADESSLRLNAILDWIETQLERIQEGSGRYPRLRKLAIALAIFVPTVGIPTHDFYFGDKTVSLSREDRRLLNELLARTKENPEVKARKQQFFKTLERDKSITSAGVAEGKTEQPIISVPAVQFAEHGGLWAIVDDDDRQERTTYPVVDVVLISPVLLPTPRTWRFQPPGLPEFGATMRDQRFLAALLHDHVRERLRVGIPMTLRLAVKEKKVDGVWQQKTGGRSVIEVISPKVE